MADDFQDYVPTTRFDNTQTLLNNHFRFAIDGLPDLTFFAQTIILPDVSAGVPHQPNPFVTIPHTADHLTFGALTVSYLIDAKFKNYFSLFYWMKGYGFPNSYDDVANFAASRKAKLGNPRPQMNDIFKTNAVLYLMAPDTDSAVAEIAFSDVFPIGIGSVTIEPQDHEPNVMRTQVSFMYTDFDVRLTAS
jgi:hypothetical protein